MDEMRLDDRQFPRGEPGETREAKRARFERWVLDQAGSRTIPTPQQAAVLSLPAHDPGATHPSLKLHVRARCWECMGGNSDPGVVGRIESCASTKCALWPIRPYKPRPPMSDTPVGLTKLLERNPDEAEERKRTGVSRRQAINDYCRDCQGGARTPNLAREVDGCAAVTCALWPVRRLVTWGGGKVEGDSGRFSGFTAQDDAANEGRREEA